MAGLCGLLKGYLKNVTLYLYGYFHSGRRSVCRMLGLFGGVFDFLAHVGNAAANGIAALAHGFAGVVDVVGGVFFDAVPGAGTGGEADGGNGEDEKVFHVFSSLCEKLKDARLLRVALLSAKTARPTADLA